MSTCENNRPYSRIDAKLAELVNPLPEKPDWHERWLRLGPQSNDEERLAVYQAIRASGLLPEDAGFYLIAWQIDEIVNRRAETALADIEQELTAIEATHGLEEGEFWGPGEAPPEYETALRQHEQAWDDLFAAQLDEHGEGEIAALFRTDPAEYERRNETGRRYFHGSRLGADSDEDDWLSSLTDVVGGSITPESLMGPLEILYSEEEGFWEVDMYSTPVELVGGPDDGAIVTPGFSVDLEQLRSAFDKIEDLGWNSIGWQDGRGPFVWIEGVYEGRELFLRLLAEPPAGQEAAMKLRVPMDGAE
jgi:hypothetical protein